MRQVSLRPALKGAAPKHRGRRLSRPTSALVALGVGLAGAGALAERQGADASAATPEVVSTLAATTTADSTTLGSWDPERNDLLVVAVTGQYRPSMSASVTGNDLHYVKVADVTNVQKVQRMQVFVARGTATAGDTTIAVPGNTGPIAAVGLQISGVDSFGTPQDVIRTVSSSAGPRADNRTMLTKVDGSQGDLVLGLGTHRFGQFNARGDQTARRTNAFIGSKGNRVGASAWSTRAASTGAISVGQANNLTRADDWALVALAVRPAGAGARPEGVGESVPTEPTRPPATLTDRPYAESSAWNTPIPADATTHARSAWFVAEMTRRGQGLSTDPTQFSYPVYQVNAETPRRTVRVANFFSRYPNDATRVGYGYAPAITEVPIPENAQGSEGGDGNVILLDPVTGTEWGFHNFARNNDGTYRASFGYQYNVNFAGRFADGKAGRGSGLPYLGGLVRASEIEAGHIDHALAFTYRYPSKHFVYPASRSDGRGTGDDLPEGSRLQLNPTLSEADFDRWGLSSAAKTMARAMQQYGMYLVDNGGSPKVIVEDDLTAQWQGKVGPRSLYGIPWSEFRVIV